MAKTKEPEPVEPEQTTPAPEAPRPDDEKDIQKRIDAAVAAAVKAERAKRQTDAENEAIEELNEENRKMHLKLADIQQRLAEKEKEALHGKVLDKVREFIGANFREFAANAPDIMNSVKPEITEDLKPPEIDKLIEAHARAFVERTRGAKGAHGAPAGMSRSRIAGVGSSPPPQEGETRQTPAPRRRFEAVNWHG